MSYVDKEYYKSFSGLVVDDLEAKLEKASNQIDSITFNRIVSLGFDDLTPFQQDKIKKSVCLHVDFIEQYGEYLNSMLSSFSAGSVSLSLNNNAFKVINNIVTSNEVYSLLKQTGLTCLRI